MSRRWLLGALLMITLIVATALWFVGSAAPLESPAQAPERPLVDPATERGGPAAPEAASPALTQDLAPLAVTPAQTLAVSSDLATEGPSFSGVLAGRVVDGQGEPRAGVTVLARPREDSDGKDSTTGAVERDTVLSEWRTRVFTNELHDELVVTGSDGRFRFDTLAPHVFDVIAGGPGLEPAALRELALGEEQEHELVVGAEARLWITAVDRETGELLPGATVRAQRRVDPGETPNGQPYRGSAKVETTSGRAALKLRDDGPQEQTGAGLVLLHTVGWAGTDVTVSAPGYAMSKETVPGFRAPGQREHRVELWRAASLAGRVLDGNARPLPGVTIKLARLHVDVPLRRQFKVTSDKNGRFALNDLTAGFWRLTGSLSGHGPFRPQIVELLNTEQRLLGDLTMPVGGTLVGSVFGDDGETEMGAIVIARSAEFPDEEDPRLNVLTNQYGKFAMNDLLPGRYWVQRVGKEPVSVWIRSGKRTDVSLQARLLPRVYGQVTRHGVPVPNATVRVLAVAPNGSRESLAETNRNTNVATTDSEGMYELLIPVGPVELTAWDDRLSSAPVSLQMHYREHQQVDLVFQSGTVSGMVVSAAGGVPLADVQVTFSNEEAGDKGWGVFSYQLGSIYQVTTGADGSYSLELPEGTWSPRAKGGEYQVGELAEINVLRDERKVGLNFALEVGGAVQGALSFEGSEWRISRLRVVVISSDGSEYELLVWDWQMVADEEPRYRIDGLPQGVHRIELQRHRETAAGLEEDVLAAASISVDLGQVTTFDFAKVQL